MFTTVRKEFTEIVERVADPGTAIPKRTPSHFDRATVKRFDFRHTRGIVRKQVCNLEKALRDLRVIFPARAFINCKRCAKLLLGLRIATEPLEQRSVFKMARRRESIAFTEYLAPQIETAAKIGFGRWQISTVDCHAAQLIERGGDIGIIRTKHTFLNCERLSRRRVCRRNATKSQ